MRHKFKTYVGNLSITSGVRHQKYARVYATSSTGKHATIYVFMDSIPEEFRVEGLFGVVFKPFTRSHVDVVGYSFIPLF